MVGFEPRQSEFRLSNAPHISTCFMLTLAKEAAVRNIQEEQTELYWNIVLARGLLALQKVQVKFTYLPLLASFIIVSTIVEY